MKQSRGGAVNLKEALDRVVLQGARPAAVCLALMYVIFILINSLKLNGPVSRLEMGLDIGVLVISVVAAVTLQRGWIPARWASYLVSGGIMVTFLNAVVTAYVDVDIYALKFVPYLIIAAGALLLSSRWLLAVMLPIYAVSLPLLLLVFSTDRILEVSLHYIASTVFAVTLHLARKQTHLRLYGLRRQDALAKTKLTIALEHSERMLQSSAAEAEKRRKLEAQLRQAQKMEAVGVLAGGIAHGMNNLLGAISSYASVLKEETPRGDPRRCDIEDILTAARRGGELTRNLLGFARKGKFLKTVVEPNHTIEQTVEILRQTIAKDIRIDLDLASTAPPIFGDPSQLGQMVMNLLLNAADAVGEGGEIRVASSFVTVPHADQPHGVGVLPGRYCAIHVVDSGSGMDDETRAHAFEPFFTTKGPDKGTGLGLAMVYGAVQSHGGEVILDSELNRGTEVTVYLPAATEEEIALVAMQKPSFKVPTRQGPRRVLLVDDEPMIRNSGKRILRRLGCEVMLARNGAEAVDAVEQESGDIDLVILDVAMPIMDGTECFYKLRDIDPELPIVISSGFADQRHTEKLIADGATGLLPKPYDLDQMVDIIRMPKGASRSGSAD